MAVAAPLDGLFRVDLTNDPPHTDLLVRAGNGASEIWLAWHVAVSGERLLAAAPYFAFGWKALASQDSHLAAQHPIAKIADVDLHDDRILILGAQKDERQRFAPDGAIAWLGALAEDPESLKPVYFSTDGPGARSMDACGVMGIGAVRFLADGRFVIVPGVEPGVFLYDANGRLDRTWGSEELGFDAGCGLTDEEMYRLSANEPARWEWVNRRRTVDEILPLADGRAALAVRSVQPEGTTWQLAVLGPEERVQTCQIPVRSTSRLAHLRGDVRGDEIVLLISVVGYRQDKSHPEVSPRIVTLRWNG